MLKTTFNYNDFYNFMTAILQSSLGLNAEKLNEIDKYDDLMYIKFRKLIWPDLNDFSNENMENMQDTKRGYLKVIKSSMKFVSVLLTIPKEISDDLIIIGPFLENQPTDDFIINLMYENNLEESLRNTIFTYYKSLPIINSLTVIETLNTILKSFFIGYDTSHIHYVNFDQKKIKKIDYMNRDDSEFNSNYYKKYRMYLSDISSCVKLGKYKEAQQYLKLYIQLIGLFNEDSLEKIKHNLYSINAKLESDLLKTSIPGSHVYILYNKIETEIRNENNIATLKKYPYKILKSYCTLSSNHNLQNYSFTIRNAIEYIHLNLNAELSLSIISGELNKNSSFLSNQFKKETGKTITKYIQESRIERAMQLLISTELSIQEISETVGIHDLSWFSKLFKNIVGVSPSQYRAIEFN